MKASGNQKYSLVYVTWLVVFDRCAPSCAGHYVFVVLETKDVVKLSAGIKGLCCLLLQVHLVKWDRFRESQLTTWRTFVFLRRIIATHSLQMKHRGCAKTETQLVDSISENNCIALFNYSRKERV